MNLGAEGYMAQKQRRRAPLVHGGATTAINSWAARMRAARTLGQVRSIMAEPDWTAADRHLPPNSPRRLSVRLDVTTEDDGTKITFVTFPNRVKTHVRLLKQLPGDTQVAAS